MTAFQQVSGELGVSRTREFSWRCGQGRSALSRGRGERQALKPLPPGSVALSLSGEGARGQG